MDVMSHSADAKHFDFQFSSIVTLWLLSGSWVIQHDCIFRVWLCFQNNLPVASARFCLTFNNWYLSSFSGDGWMDSVVHSDLDAKLLGFGHEQTEDRLVVESMDSFRVVEWVREGGSRLPAPGTVPVIMILQKRNKIMETRAKEKPCV